MLFQIRDFERDLRFQHAARDDEPSQARQRRQVLHVAHVAQNARQQ